MIELSESGLVQERLMDVEVWLVVLKIGAELLSAASAGNWPK